MSAAAQTLDNNFDLQAVQENLQDNSFLQVPIDLVSPRPGFNHRRYFDEKALEELAEDIRQHGITQPLAIRPTPEKDGFHIIAGERRYLAAKRVGLATIPAMVRLVSDAEAYAISVSENLQREDISPAEEAIIAHRAIGLSDGDRDEAARLLGWSRRKIDARMLLLHCAKPVLAALAERKIALGHAELLAGLPQAMQEETLPGLIERGVSVAELRESIGRYAYRLDSAPFDTGDCANCMNNSEQTQDLFGEHVGSGRCLNRACFDEKVAQWIESRRKEVQEQHNAVFLDTEKADDQRVFLVRDGGGGVGREQYTACQSCANYGALMHTAKGREGELEEGLCFDLECNHKKVAIHRKILEAETNPAKEEQPKDAGPSSDLPAPVKRKAPKTKAKGQAEKLSAKLTEYRDTLHYRAASGEVPSDTHLVKVLSLSALMNEAAKVPEALADRIRQLSIPESSKGRDKQLKRLLELDDTQIDDLISAYAAALVSDNHANQWQKPPHLGMARVVLAHHDDPLDRYFSMSEAYLEMLTVSAIKALLEEAGFDSWMNQQEEKGYAKFLKSHNKKADLVKAIMASAFDWKGFVPKLMRP